MLGISAREKQVLWLNYVAIRLAQWWNMLSLSNNVTCVRNSSRRHIRVG